MHIHFQAKDLCCVAAFSYELLKAIPWKESSKPTGNRGNSCYFWRTESGAELDLIIDHEGRKNGFEFKMKLGIGITDKPRILEVTVPKYGAKDKAFNFIILISNVQNLDFRSKPSLLPQYLR